MSNAEYVDFEEVKERPKTEEEQQREKYNEMLHNEEFARVFMKLHTPLNASKLPDRNDPCPCGSGKKFKKCECT